MDFNEEQQSALDAIRSFITSETEVFVLCGYAGTGKTTLLKQVVEEALCSERAIQLMAPTGRAANVLKQKTGEEATTIHRGIYDFGGVVVKVDEEDIARTDVKFHYPIRENDAPVLCIVDEGSMISNAFSEGELWSFGTGHLLDDLITYANFKNGGKLLVVGDPGQLPPVGEPQSKALTAAFYEEKGLHCEQATLTQVMRQDDGSLILSNAMSARDAYEQQDFASFSMKEGNGVEKMLSSDVIDRYLKMCPVPEIGNSVVICYANRLANSYNRRIRERLYGEENAPMRSGDVMIVAANHYDRTADNNQARDIMNGEFCKVLDVCRTESHTAPVYVGEERKNITVCYAEARLLLQTGEIWEGWVVTDPVLSAEDGKISISMLKSMYIDFCMRHPDLSRRTNSEEFRKALREDPFLNALKVRYGYSVTCHKSQGGEWDTVFIDFDGVHLDRFGARWIYTATTRARKMAYVVNSPDVSPMQKLQVGNTVVSKMPIACFPAPVPEKPVESPFHADDAPQFLISKYAEVLTLIDGSGYSVMDICHLQYVERYKFAAPSGAVVTVDFGYNGRGVFRLPSSSDNELKTLLNRTADHPLSYPELRYEPEAPVAVRLFDRMVEACAAAGVKILSVSERLENWSITYCLQSAGKFAWIDFTINKKGFVTYASPHTDMADDAPLKRLLDILAEES